MVCGEPLACAVVIEAATFRITIHTQWSAGMMQGSAVDEMKVRGNAMLAFLALGLLSGATSLPLFGFTARIVWWREQERGVNSLSYYLASTMVSMIGEWARSTCHLQPASGSVALPCCLHVLPPLCCRCGGAGDIASCQSARLLARPWAAVAVARVCMPTE